MSIQHSTTAVSKGKGMADDWNANHVVGSSLAIPFTDGDTVRRVTITDADVTMASKIFITIRRPDSADDSEDTGYLYFANVVLQSAGSFDVLIVCTDWGFGDPVENPPNETITLYYVVG